MNLRQRADGMAAVLRGRRGAAVLSIGTLASGVLAYVFNILAARTLGAEAYGPVAILWASVFLVSIVLFRPAEQTLSRGISDRLARGRDATAVVRSSVLLVVCLVFVSVLACIVAWQPLTDGLFDGEPALTVALIAGIVGYAASFTLRGLLGGVRWFGGYGALLLADGVVRVIIALPLLFVASPAVAGAAVAGAALGGALVPLLFHGRRRLREVRQPGASEPYTPSQAGRFGAPVMVVAASDQILVSGGPLLVVLAGGPGSHLAAGTVFAATMLVRAPVFLFQGFAAALLPSLTTLRAIGDGGRFRRAVWRTIAVLSAFAVLLTLAMLAIGPELMRAFYGAGFEVTRGDLGMLAAGVGCYLAGSTFSQVALARGATARAGLVWALSAIVFVAVELSATGDAVHRVAIAFLIATALNVALFVPLVMRREHAPSEAAVGAPQGASAAV